MTRVTITSADDSRHSVRNEAGEEVARFIRHPGDWSFDLDILVDGTATCAAQHHVTDPASVEERLARIFDDTSLRDEISKLRDLRNEKEDLWNEKAVVTDTQRYDALTTGGLLREADEAYTVQRDIVAAKIVLELGISPYELHDLGLR